MTAPSPARDRTGLPPVPALPCFFREFRRLAGVEGCGPKETALGLRELCRVIKQPYGHGEMLSRSGQAVSSLYPADRLHLLPPFHRGHE